MDPDNMELVRVPREEHMIAREDVLGRDTASVFPSEAKRRLTEAKSTALEMLGAKMFISESELEAITVARGGGSVEDGTVSADKPLAVLLQENRERKEAEFQEKLRIIKQGTHKPLDADEATFLETVAEEQAAKDREWRQQQQEELEAYREALLAAQQEKAAEPESSTAQHSRPAGPAPPPRKPEPKKPSGPTIVIKPRARPAPPTPANTPEVKRVKRMDQRADAQLVPAVLQAAAKLAAGVEQQQQQQQAGTGSSPAATPAAQPAELAGLLGGYGSGSEED